MKEHFDVVEGMTDAPKPIDPMVTRGRLLPVGTVSITDAPYKFATKLMTTSAVAMHETNSWFTRRLFFQGFVRYNDVFGKHYVTGFPALFSPEANTWVLRGGDDYNYTHEENPDAIPEWKEET